MRPARRLLLTIMVAVMVMSFLTGNAQATSFSGSGGSLMVSIESADYLALNTDQIENDILTEFTLYLPTGYWVYGWTYIYCEIELPSGGYFYTELLIWASYSRLSLTLAWHNTATESGWYTFFVYADILGQNILRPGIDSFVFDPPTDGGPDDPLLEIVQIIAY